MRSALSGWEVELAQWLKPFLDRLGHKARHPHRRIFLLDGWNRGYVAFERHDFTP
jgi:hypothetical protein